jgi:hypothetical protein
MGTGLGAKYRVRAPKDRMITKYKLNFWGLDFSILNSDLYKKSMSST